VIEEISGAYENIDEVMRNQPDLVEIVAELKQVVCLKG
jgi:tRNA-splicing ligase RtcB